MAARTEYDELRPLVCRTPIPDTGRNVIRTSELQEAHDALSQLSITHKRMQALAEVLAREPVTPTQTAQARVGNMITGVYDDEAGKEIEMSFVLGAPGEPEIYGKLEHPIPILNYEGDFGKKFLGRRVGDTLEVKLQKRLVDFEITEIGIPPVVETGKVARLAVA